MPARAASRSVRQVRHEFSQPPCGVSLMHTFTDGWLLFWSWFTLPLPAFCGFTVGYLVWVFVGGFVLAAVKDGLHWVRRNGRAV